MSKLLRELLPGFTCLLTMVSPAIAQDINFDRVLPLQGSVISIKGAFAVITGITQDKQGYMWFASSGLYKYDGFHMTHFLHDPANKNTIQSNYVECVYTDREGMIWIGTSTGLDKLDPSTNSFTHFVSRKEDPHSLVSDYVTCILEEHAGDLWVGTTAGLCRMDYRTGQFTRFLHDDKDRFSISNDDIRVIYQDSLDNIWIGCGDATDHSKSGTSGGLNRYLPRSKTFYHYMHDANDPLSLYDNHIRSLVEDRNGDLWVGSEGNILHKLNRNTGNFERYSFEGDRLASSYRPSSRISPLGNDHITFLQTDMTGSIWIGTLLSGLCRLDPITGRVTHYSRETRPGGFPDGQCWWSFLSHDGVLWVSTWEGNVYKADPYQQNLHHKDVGAEVFALQEYGGLLWIGTRKGLIIQDSTGKKVEPQFVSHYADLARLNNGYPQAFCIDPRHSLWIGTAISGLYQVSLDHHTVDHYANNPSDSNTINPGHIFDLEADPEGIIWVATDLGLDRLDPMHHRVTHYLNDPADSLSMSLNYVSRIKRDQRGNLWVGTITGGGLNRLNTRTGKFQRYLRGANIYGLFEDSQGRIWAGTDDGIYSSHDMKTFSKLNVFNQDEELGIVLSIMEDKKGNLWFQTYDGLVRLNKEGKNPKLFGKNQGYYSMSSTSGPNYFISRRGDWGELLYGDNTGYYTVFPENLRSNPHPPQIAISQFKLQDTTGKHDLVLTLKDDRGSDNKIQLSHDQNAFSVDLAVIHYTSPEDNRLQYMMENYEKSWRQGVPAQTVYYYNLNPGNYQLKVRAANSDGVWVERSISIVISPPWWQTWWAYSIYGLLILLALYGIHRYQKARYIRLERERSRAKELAQAKEIEKAYHELRKMQNQLIQQEKMASLGELTAGIAHEIQNPLNFVNNFSEVNAELLMEMKEMLDNAHYDGARSIAEEIIRNEQKIVDHGHRADNIVKNMLQHSRSSSGMMEPVSLNSMADEYMKLAYHGLRAKDKNFNAIIHKDFDPGISNVNLVSQDIGRVLLNLYNNAFYAVAEKKTEDQPGYEPTIWLRTKNLGKNVEINIRDNGSGITQKNKDKIFQPFFTTKPTGQGTGLGLSISYDIIKAHGGEIRVESVAGEGSNFIVQLPA